MPKKTRKRKRLKKMIDSETINGEHRFTVQESDEGERLDVLCARKIGETRSFIQKLIIDSLISINEKPAKSGQKLKCGDKIDIVLPQPQELEAKPENIPISIVYEDADIAVIDKAQGMVVHPAAGNEDGTLVNALLFHLHDLSGIGGILRPGIVHRIDKMTSGLLVVAKNDMAHNSLSAQIKDHSAGRVYLALAEGNFKEDSGTIDAPIGRHPKDRKKMAVVQNGKEAVTHWQVLARYGDFTLLKIKLETGRTHQIRVHLSSIGHPIAGDTVYGRNKAMLGLEGQALHACRLHLRHPRTGEDMIFAAPVPQWYISAVIKAGGIGFSQTQVDLWLNQNEEKS